jgi:hypothetical protein
MKKLIALTLLSVLFISAMRPYLPYVDYAINKSYIAKVLCENIEKPKLECNGKCHLKKELKKAKAIDYSEKETTIRSNEKEHVYLCYSGIISDSDFNIQQKEEILIGIYTYQNHPFCKPPTPPPKRLFS